MIIQIWPRHTHFVLYHATERERCGFWFGMKLVRLTLDNDSVVRFVAVLFTFFEAARLGTVRRGQPRRYEEEKTGRCVEQNRVLVGAPVDEIAPNLLRSAKQPESFHKLLVFLGRTDADP
jgi:hypothetical protein